MKHLMHCSGEDRDNIEANIFAMNLLVPDRLLEKEPPIDLIDDEQLKEISKRYKVPIGIMAVRLNKFYLQKAGA